MDPPPVGLDAPAAARGAVRATVPTPVEATVTADGGTPEAAAAARRKELMTGEPLRLPATSVALPHTARL